jgi:hypothetical protein
MLLLRHPDAMSPANFPTLSSTVLHDDAYAHSGSSAAAAATGSHASSNGFATANAGRPGSNARASAVASAVPHDVIDRLVVYVAGPHDDPAVAELLARAEQERPDGALMVAAADGALLAAGSLSDGAVVGEPSPSGAAAAAVVRYRIASLRRRQGVRRLAAA